MYIIYIYLYYIYICINRFFNNESDCDESEIPKIFIIFNYI